VARAVLLYDRDCGFCRVAAAAVLAWDRRRELRPVAIQAPEADLLLGGAVPLERRLESWHLVVEPDREGAPPLEVFSAGSAFEPLFRLLPGGSGLARLTARFPRGARRAYDLVAGNRSRLGRMLPRRLRARADMLITARGGSGKRPIGR
jgi:predicted DCC family thiol-disulfide oxidoreductase YuxK